MNLSGLERLAAARCSPHSEREEMLLSGTGTRGVEIARTGAPLGGGVLAAWEKLNILHRLWDRPPPLLEALRCPVLYPGSISTTASPTIPKPSASSTFMRAASSRHSPPR